MYISLRGSKGQAGGVPKFSPNPGFDHRNFQPTAPLSLHIKFSHLDRERKWHSHSILSVGGTVCDTVCYIMVKIVRLILFVGRRRMEEFDVCTFDRNMRTTWN